MVRRVTAQPLLKGMPGRGFKHTVKHHETGRRVAVKNPDGPTYLDLPHLAHVDPAEFDEVNALLDAANARLRPQARQRGRPPARGCRASGPGSPASTPAAGTAAASSSGAATA